MASVITGGLAVWLSDDGSGSVSERPITVGEPTPGRLPTDTGLVLIFDDGYDGVTLVDLDRRVAVRRPIEGQRAGDQPARLTLVDDALIVGWGEVYAAPLDGGESQLLDDATISIPAAEPDLVWLVDYPGERIGTGVPTLRQVDVVGEVVNEAEGLDPMLYYPGVGIPGGVAYETSRGVALWDARRGEVTSRLGATPVFIGRSHHDLLAWCPTGCTSLRVSRLRGGDDLVVPRPSGSLGFDVRSSRFSPDGRLLAVNALRQMMIVETTSGASWTFPTPQINEAIYSLGWSPDGRYLFFASSSYGADETLVGLYDADTEAVVTETLQFGGALSFVSSRRTRPRRCSMRR